MARRDLKVRRKGVAAGVDGRLGRARRQAEFGSRRRVNVRVERSGAKKPRRAGTGTNRLGHSTPCLREVPSAFVDPRQD